MSAIDQVIARARQGDVGFAERKQFKLARTRAIEKLRHFALADPYFYILEIIQAAVAGGADYVDISCGNGDVLVSWTGPAVDEADLAQLFDFLFASKERIDLAHIRSLALGINALMLFDPEQVVIESGDGRPGGTTRMVVRAGADQVEVGRAEGVFAGTYVRASKLNRDKVAADTNRRGDAHGSLEYATVELRCLAAPVPIVFNGQPLFGWSRDRVPKVFGYERVRSFDEGDLYGSIGLTPTGNGTPSFQILTHGVWVQSYQYELLGNHKFGGVVCFDRLHKTVDHSGFVQDDRFAEMWVRLRPYAEDLVGGRPHHEARITSAEGLEYTPAELREYLHDRSRIVAVAPKFSDEGVSNAEACRRGEAIARLLDAEVLRVDDSQVTAVRVLGGRELLIWRPLLTDARDHRFYDQPLLEAPSLPHLLPPVELECPTLDALIDELQIGDAHQFLAKLVRAQLLDESARVGELDHRLKRQLRVMLGETGGFRATLYSPVDPGMAAGGLLVRVTSTGRLLGERLYASAYPGRVLDVELPTAQPTVMLEMHLALQVAERFAARALPLLAEQDQRALAGLGVGKVEPDTVAAHLALQVLSRVTVTRLRAARPGRMTPGLSFSLVRVVSGFDPFALPLLRTLDGAPISLRELALICDHTGGLVYGTIPEVPADLEGLDRARILALDAGLERTLIGLLGEAAYVRVDARDVLARAGGVVVRDIALGLREYPEFPLLVEGEVAQLETLDEQSSDALLTELINHLVGRMLGELDEPGGDPLELEEHRRQAVRHLQWVACRELARGRGEALERWGLLDLPLFVDLDGEVWDLHHVAEALRSPEGLLVHYGHGLGGVELGSLCAAARAGRRSAEGRPASLALSGFGYRLLVPLGRVRLAFDFDLDDIEAARNPMTSGVAFLVSEPFTASWGAGVLGVPATRLDEYRIQLRTRERGAVAALDELAHIYGVVGVIELHQGQAGQGTSEAIIAAVDQRATALLEQLITKLPEFADDPRRHAAALRVLLTYVGEQLTLIAGPSGLSTQVATSLATRILGLPLFDTGEATLISGQRMLERFRRAFERQLFASRDAAAPFEAIDWSAVLADTAPSIVREWLDAHLQPAAVIMPASSGQGSPASSRPDPDAEQPDDPGELDRWPADRPLTSDALAWNLGHWLAALRPDPRDAGDTRIWVFSHDLQSGAMIEGGDLRIEVAGVFPLVTRALADPQPAALAWLLLAIYAHINAVTGMVTNAHEARFQVIVSEALLGGRLAMLVPPTSAAR